MCYLKLYSINSSSVSGQSEHFSLYLLMTSWYGTILSIVMVERFIFLLRTKIAFPSGVNWQEELLYASSSIVFILTPVFKFQMLLGIFISYSRKDIKLVKAFHDELVKLGYCVWMDVDGIESSDIFKVKIVSSSWKKSSNLDVISLVFPIFVIEINLIVIKLVWLYEVL